MNLLVNNTGPPRWVYSMLNTQTARQCLYMTSSCTNTNTNANTTNATYDVIVIGGGHAGTEACAAAARMGARTALLTLNKNTLGEMSCNPSFGGIGKGQLVREVDALGGVCGRICDKAGIQFKTLNLSKGPAVYGPRAQMDRHIYKRAMQDELLKNTPNLTVIEGSVEDLILSQCDKHKIPLVTGVKMGLKTFPAGRHGEKPSIGLADTLYKMGFKIGRLKTGTPPRLDGTTIDYSDLKKEWGDVIPKPFSYMNDSIELVKNQVCCHITHTNEMAHEVIRRTNHLNGHIQGDIRGPRFCPSIESKIIRFAHHDRHLIWLEPEGLNSNIIYPGGISMTLPEEHQLEFLRCIKGFESVVMTRPGYGVAYDHVDPRELHQSLETKKIGGLFLAGQINGSTGYEEAAAQGIMAGINAVLKIKGEQPLILQRYEAYIGILIDDLVHNGAPEPYRMFTSRSEYRLTVRADNADIRLTHKGALIGCVSPERLARLEKTEIDLSERRTTLKGIKKKCSEWAKVPGLQTSVHQPSKSALEVLKCPVLDLDQFHKAIANDIPDLSLNLLERIRIEALYENLVKRMKRDIENYQRDEAMLLPDDIDYT
eukprot:Ihof_evm9s118 gene=Ihof_evmTU9s118